MHTFPDHYAGRHTTSNAEAVVHFEHAVRALAAHQSVAPHLQQALRLDPGLPAAHALSGLSCALLGRGKGFEQSRLMLAATNRALSDARGGTPHERALAAAHAAAAEGYLSRAAFILERHVELHPAEFLPIKLAHAIRFMTGEPRRMLDTLDLALPHWSHRDEGYGFLLGCRSFALEETGQIDEAEVAGRMAVMHEPADVWGLHAVAHTMEMSGRTAEGIAWLAPTAGQWARVGIFGQHLAWHLALFHLAGADTVAALALFDNQLKPDPDGDFRDVANAVSLLWRLEQEGVAVGDRWISLHAIAAARRHDSAYAFASLHYLLALVARRDLDGAEDVVAALRASAQAGDKDQSIVAARIAVALAEAIVSAARRREHRVALSKLAARLPLLGGSMAQRDVFLRTLMAMAFEAEDTVSFQALATMRRQERRVDRYQSLLERRAYDPRVRSRSFRSAPMAAWS